MRIPRRFLVVVAPLPPLVLVIASLHPYAAASGIPVNTSMHHRYLHVLAYGLSALWLALASRTMKARIGAFLAMVLLGAGLELMQHLVFHCPFEWWDVRDDSIGIFAAVLLDQWPSLRSRIVD